MLHPVRRTVWLLFYSITLIYCLKKGQACLYFHFNGSEGGLITHLISYLCLIRFRSVPCVSRTLLPFSRSPSLSLICITMLLLDASFCRLSDATLRHPLEIWNTHAVDIRICSLVPSISHVQSCLFNEFPLATQMISLRIVNFNYEHTHARRQINFNVIGFIAERKRAWTGRDEYK